MSYLNFKNQVDLLLDIVELSLSDPRLALKGGTAINLFLEDMPRLSVDIDICFLPLVNRDNFIEQYKQICQELTEKFQRLPRVLVNIPKKSDGFPKHIRVLRDKQVVKVEINWVVRGSVYEPSNRNLCTKAKRAFEKGANVKVLSFEDLYAGKFCAALDRQHPRDLFDVMFFFKRHEITEKLKKAFLIYLLSSNRPISEMISPNRLDVRESYKNEFLGMTEYEVTYEELEAARTELIDKINGSLNETDKEFLLSFKSGEPKWDLLNVDHAKSLPSVMWKLHNIRNMDSEKHQKSLSELKRKLGL